VFIRRLNIFAGILQNCLQVGIILTGNYNFFNILTVVVNLSNFDDMFLRAVIPKFVLRICELDVDVSRSATKVDDTLDEVKEQEEDENDITEILRNRDLRGLKEDEIERSSTFTHEVIMFVNMLCLSLLIAFFWLYPLKDLLPGTLTTTKETLGRVYNNQVMNTYMTFLFIYIMIQFLRGHVKLINNEHNNGGGGNNLSMLVKSFKLLPFSVFILLYYLHATSVFYHGIDLKVPRSAIGKYVEQGMEFSDNIFTRFRICHGYGLFRRMTGVGFRPELEVKYQTIDSIKADKYETLNFIYKINDNALPKFNVPHQPRVDWQIWFSALSHDINTEPWLIIMLGKVLERNPVTLDLLGYQIEDKQFYYKGI
jgi:hypothetical protein